MSRKALYICLAISIVALSLIAAKKNQISAYYALPCCNWGTVVLPASGEFTAIQNLSLPAGTYVANATAALAFESTVTFRWTAFSCWTEPCKVRWRVLQ